MVIPLNELGSSANTAGRHVASTRKVEDASRVGDAGHRRFPNLWTCRYPTLPPCDQDIRDT